MSLDASNPEIKASQPPQPDVDPKTFEEGHHPTDGVMPFKDGELPEVGPVLLERGVPEASTIDSETLEVPVDKIEIVVTPQRRGLGKKGIASVVAGTLAAGVLAGVGASRLFGSDEPAPEGERTVAVDTPNDAPDPEVSAPVEPEGETTTSPIEDLNKKATPEQIEFVKTTPVTLESAPTMTAALEQLGQRWNVMLNSGELDYDYGDRVTADSQAELLEMANAVMTPDSDAFESVMQTLAARRTQIAAMMGDPIYGGDPSAESHFSIRNTGPDTPLEAGQTYTTTAEYIYSTNRADTQSGDGEYNDDYSSDDMTITVSDAGEIRIVTPGRATNIGNIG